MCVVGTNWGTKHTEIKKKTKTKTLTAICKELEAKKRKKKKGGGSKNRVLRLSPALSTTRGKLAQPVSPAQLLDTRLPSSHIRNGLAPTQGGSKGTWTFAPFGSQLRSTNKTLPDFLLASKQIVLI